MADKQIDFSKCPSFQKLPSKYQRFTLEIVKGTERADAYKKIYKCSRKSALCNVDRLIRNDKIAASIEEIKSQLRQFDIADAVELREFWTNIIRGNITDLVHFNESGSAFTKNSDDMPKEQSRLIKKIKVREFTTTTKPRGEASPIVTTEVETTLELHDPIKASELLARDLGMLKDKIELTGENGGPIQFSDVERASRLQHLLTIAMERKAKGKAKGKAK